MIASSSSKPRRCRSAAVVGLQLFVVAVAVVLVAPAQASRKDHTPPTFAGLKSATTCIAGPVGTGRTSSYHLSWAAATDDVTPSSKIVYNVYQATTAGGEDFSKATYTTAAGVTSFDTPQLPVDKYFYFVVRARDLAGNEDSNTVERQGQNLCV
jgi:hypothetical protein